MRVGLQHKGAANFHRRLPVNNLPKTAHKEDLVDMEEPDLIDGFAEFPEAALEAFVERVNAADKDR